MLTMKNIIILIILILILIGCNTQRTEKPKEYDYRQGTEGLEIEFPVELPDEIYENDRNVKFVVEIRNRGAFPQIEEEGEFEGYLWIGGYDPDIIDISPDRGVTLDEYELEGKSQYNEKGGYTAVEFDANVYDLPAGAPYYKPTLIFTTTYFYKTIASPVVCIDPQPRSSYIRDKVCEVRDTTMSSQGAPVSVTKIEQDVSSEKILFKVFVQNAGNGLVIPREDIDRDPNEGYDWRDLNEIKIDDIRVGDLRMSSCRPDVGDTLELIDGHGYIYCRLDKSLVGDRVYTTPLTVELSYGYSTSESKNIEIFEEIEY